MCSVYSAVSGEVIAVVDEYEGKTAKEIKQFLAARVGVTRFRQRFFLEDGSSEIVDGDFFAPDPVRIHLVLLEFLPPDALEDQTMIAAARDNDSKALEKMLQEPRSPNVAGEDDWTPLHWAAFNGRVEPMRLLLEAGAPKDARDQGNEGWTPLLCAGFNGHLDSVGLLLEVGVEVNCAMLQTGETPLHVAAFNGDLAVVQLLIGAGADLNQGRTDLGTTPLFVSAENGQVEVVRLLIEAWALLNRAAAEDGATPLHVAAQNGHIEVVRVLTEAGADVKATTDYGATPLHEAARYGQVQIVQALIEGGADLNQAETDDGATALHVAARGGQVEVVQLLIEAGGDLKARTDTGTIPLFEAAWKGHYGVVLALTKARADPYQTVWALVAAAEARNDKAFISLMKAKAEAVLARRAAAMQ